MVLFKSGLMLKAALYLNGSGSNAVDQRDEEEDDEGVSCALHAILFSVRSITPLAFSQYEKRWARQESDKNRMISLSFTRYHLEILNKNPVHINT